MERFLGTAEHYFWLHDQVLPIHFALTARISGNFSLDQLRRSLTQVQLQHPLLRVRIAVSETGHPKFVEQIAPIPLRLAVRSDEHCWQREVEIELTRSFDWTTAPLFRVVLLQSETVSELIVTCHHAIADGMSVAYLIRDIVQGLESESSSTRKLSEVPPIDQLIPGQESATAPQATSSREYSTIVSSRPRPHVRTALLSAKLTEQVCDRARQEKTSVHSAISAAFLLAMARQREVVLKCKSPINVRSQLTPSPGETMGLYISYGITHHDLKPDSSLWETARSLKAQLAEIMSSSQVFAVIYQAQTQLASLPAAEAVCFALQQPPNCDLIVTNLGRLPFEAQFGSLQLEAIYGPAVLNGMEHERLVGVATLGDRLSLTVTQPSTTSETEASASLEEALALLNQAVLAPWRESRPLFVV